MSDETADNDAVDADSVGVRLRQAREAKGLQLESAAEAMRLSPEVLVALEADRFDTLGAQVFVKGHLRQYSHLLGIDADEIIDGYQRQDHPTDEPLVGVGTEPIKLRDDNEIRLMVAVGVVVVLLLTLFLWWWANPEDNSPLQSEVSEASLPVEVALPSAALPIAESQAEVTLPDVVAPAVTVADSIGSAGAETASIDAPAPETASLGPVSFAVEVIFPEDCWAEIFGGNDERLFYCLGQAGARSRFTATAPMTVLLGNAGGVQINVNGQAYPIPAGARQGNLARFVVVDLP